MTTNSKNLAMMLVGFAAIISVGVFSAVNTVEASQEDVPGVMGHITLILKDSEGNIKDYVQTDNIVTQTGLNCITENSFGVNTACDDGKFFTFLGLGIGNTETLENLQTPLLIGCIRDDANTKTSSGTTTETITLESVFGGNLSGATGIANDACEGTISEAGVFNDVTGAAGQMFAYQTFTGIVIGDSDTLTVTWTIQIPIT